MGAPKGNRNRAKDKVYKRRVISLSGPEYDAAMKCLEDQGIDSPTDKEIFKAMSELDWSRFGFHLPSSEEEDEAKRREAEESELATARADYQWIRECEVLSIEKLKEIIAAGPLPGDKLSEEDRA